MSAIHERNPAALRRFFDTLQKESDPAAFKLAEALVPSLPGALVCLRLHSGVAQLPASFVKKLYRTALAVVHAAAHVAATHAVPADSVEEGPPAERDLVEEDRERCGKPF